MYLQVNLRTFSVGLLLALGLGACAQIGVGPGAGLGQGEHSQMIANVGQTELRSVPVTKWVDGKQAILYSNHDGRIAFRLGDSEQFLDEDAPVKGGRFLSLTVQGQRVYAMWWSHEGAKSVYFKASVDGGKTFAPVRTVQTGHGILPPFSLAVDGNTLGVAYMDERASAYRIYFNRSIDNGATWDAQDVRLDGTQPKEVKGAKSDALAVEPHMVQAGKNWVVVWEEKLSEKNGTVFRMVSRLSKDGGATWAKEVEIFRGGELLGFTDLAASGDHVFLVGDYGAKGVALFKSGDGGASWQAAGVSSGSETGYNSQIRMLLSKDRGYVIYTSEEKDKMPKKNAIKESTFSVENGTWLGNATRLDAKTVDNTNASNPDIAVLQSGIPVAVWEDYRNIRPGIYMSYSVDGGNTWLGDASVEMAPGAFSSFFPKVGADGDVAWVYFERYDGDDRKARNYHGIRLAYDPAAKRVVSEYAGAEHAVTQAEKEARLRERAEKFWALRVANDFDHQYDFYDFAYRGAITRDGYTKYLGNIKYNKCIVEKAEVTGNVGKVTLFYNFEVPTTMIMGNVFSQPAKDARMTEEWVWVYDDWYLVHQTAQGNRELYY